jgi:hypothetical protein
MLLVCASALMGCDPGVHVAWERDFDSAINGDCVEQALRTVAPDVTRTTYVATATEREASDGELR